MPPAGHRYLCQTVGGGVAADLVTLVYPVDELWAGGRPREADRGGVDGLSLHVTWGDGGNCDGGGGEREEGGGGEKTSVKVVFVGV